MNASDHSVSHLVDMANDIAAYFQTQPDHAEAVEGMLVHMQKFWEPRMRRKIVRQLQDGHGDGLSPLARDAIAALGQRIDPETGVLRAA